MCGDELTEKYTLKFSSQNAKKWQVKKSQEVEIRRKSQGRPKIQTTRLYLLVFIVFRIMLIVGFDCLFILIFNLECKTDQEDQKAIQNSRRGYCGKYLSVRYVASMVRKYCFVH